MQKVRISKPLMGENCSCDRMGASADGRSMGTLFAFEPADARSSMRLIYTRIAQVLLAIRGAD